MILAFKERFKEPIIHGKKIHTIREDSGNRWRPGMKIHMATGVRTKNYNCFNESACLSVQDIQIKFPTEYINDMVVIVDQFVLPFKQVQQLAYNDGFEHVIDFALWFQDDFKGKIIHWTDLKY